VGFQENAFFIQTMEQFPKQIFAGVTYQTFRISTG